MIKKVMEVREVSAKYDLQTAKPGVPVGYKQTEVGVTNSSGTNWDAGIGGPPGGGMDSRRIPEDWILCQLSDALTLQRGYDLPHRLRKAGEFPIVSSSGVSGTHTVATVEGPGVVTGRYGTIGEIFYVQGKYWPLNTTLYVRDFKGNDPKFIYYLLHRVDFLSHSGKSGVPGVNRNDVHKEPVRLPPTNEQLAIATTLSDMDALLDGLDQLITKKRDLKQAAMQQLLTGQTRLPGFEGEWELMRLGELGYTYGGLTGKTKADFGSGTAQYVTFTSVMNNVLIDIAMLEQVKVDPTESQNRVMRYDLLFNGSSETPEEVAMCSLMTENISNLYLNSFCFGFRLMNDTAADVLFLAYYIRSTEGRELMKSLAQGSTRYNLSKRALIEATVRIPGKEEQTAIATVLSDMDTEIESLEQHRNKTRDLKQAMMQELLTGRTRLI